MPDDHEPPGEMTNKELRDAITQAEPQTEEWHALVSEACKRTSFPRSWLPRGVSWDTTKSTGPSAW
jgi:hypothetical protein